MIAFYTRVTDESKKAVVKVKSANLDSLHRIGGYTRKTAKNSIKDAPKTTTGTIERGQYKVHGNKKESFKRKMREGYSGQDKKNVEFYKQYQRDTKRTTYANSKPGAVPFTHKQKKLRRSVTFKVDKKAGSVVVGSMRDVIADIAALHEHGGKRRLTGWRKGKWGKYKKRPFMEPARQATEPHISSKWAKTIR